MTETSGLERLLSGDLPPSVYSLETDQAQLKIGEMLAEGGFNFFYLDGTLIRSEQDFFREAQQALNFPDYFGMNWDAFDDSVTDLSWLPLSRGNVILYDDFDEFAKANMDQFKLAYYGLDYATRRATAALPCYVLMRGDMALLPEKIRKLGKGV